MLIPARTINVSEIGSPYFRLNSSLDCPRIVVPASKAIRSIFMSFSNFLVTIVAARCLGITKSNPNSLDFRHADFIATPAASSLSAISHDPPLPAQPPLGKAQQQQHQEDQRQIPQILGLARGHAGLGKGNGAGEFAEVGGLP